MPKRLLLISILGILLAPSTMGQSIDREFQENILSYLADDICQGRECGRAGSAAAATLIYDEFRQMGLNPLKWKMLQSFRMNDSVVVRNVFGVVPALKPTDRYIVVSAHYDHLGKIYSTIYNGADDNASGVTVMLSLARMFSQQRLAGHAPYKNIIFVAFDGHEKNMCGSQWFVDHLSDLGISAKQIDCNVNIDIIGTDLEPVGINPNYIIALGEKTLPEKYHGLLTYFSFNERHRMDMDLTFYGSKNFTKIIYETGDQQHFRKAGIPAVLFTSGFNKYTLKPTDDVQIINFELLRKRTLLIYDFVNAICY